MSNATLTPNEAQLRREEPSTEPCLGLAWGFYEQTAYPTWCQSPTKMYKVLYLGLLRERYLASWSAQLRAYRSDTMQPNSVNTDSS